MRAFIRLFAFSGTILILLAPVNSSARAGSQEITLQLMPSVIKLSPNEKAEVRVVASNPTGEVIQDLKLTNSTNAGVGVTFEVQPETILQPGGSLVWAGSITRASEGSAAGNIYFQLSFTRKSAAGARTVTGVASATLEVQDTNLEPIDKVATIRIETTLEQLRESRHFIVFLIISNISADPISITSIKVDKAQLSQDDKPHPIRVDKPEFIDKCQVLLDVPSTLHLKLDEPLAPQQSRAFPFAVYTDDSVQPGKSMLLFEAEVKQKKYGHDWKGTLITQHKFTVGVAGESEMLTAVGVPSLLLLPGFLFLVMFMFLWNNVRPKAPAINLDLKRPEFWAISILLSILAAKTYPYITDLFGQSRDYLESYGLKDLIIIWTGSVAFGVIVWTLVVGGKRLLIWWYIPSPGEKPVELLRKLARNKMGLTLRQVSVTVEGQQKQVFDVTPPRFRWLAPGNLVAPEIKITTDVGSEGKYITDLKDEINRLKDATDPGKMKNFISLIEREMNNKNIYVAWADPKMGVSLVEEIRTGDRPRSIIGQV